VTIGNNGHFETVEFDPHQMSMDRLTSNVPEQWTHDHAPEGTSRYLSFDCGLVLSCEAVDGLQWYGFPILNAIHARHHEEGHTKPQWDILERTKHADDGLSSEVGFACTCDEKYVVTVSTVIALAEKPRTLLMDWAAQEAEEAEQDREEESARSADPGDDLSDIGGDRRRAQEYPH
jgi:hypothetical protein